MAKLTATKIKAIKDPGRYGDGDGLCLLVKKSGSRSWVVRIQKDGKRRDIGLGSAKKVPLALARERSQIVRVQIEAGLDPVIERKKAAGIPIFREAAALVYEEQRKTWKNAKHNYQWMQSLEHFAFPSIGDMAVDKIEGPAVRDLLVQIWLTKHETAQRVRQRINTVLDWSVAKGYRQHSLPMNVINKSLPKIPKGQKKHHAAMPFDDIPAFMSQLRGKTGFGSLALQFSVLNASRPGEVRLATWSEIEVEAATWTIPSERMKMGREHIVPLTKPALDVLRLAKEMADGGEQLIFPGFRRGRPLSDMAMVKILRDFGLSYTAHGFRSSFRDWVAEKTEFAGDTAEAALAHVVKDQTEAAYRRGTQFEKRRTLMNAWSSYCMDNQSEDIIELAIG